MMSQPVMEILFSIVILSLPATVALGIVAALGKGIVSTITRKDGVSAAKTTQALRPREA